MRDLPSATATGVHGGSGRHDGVAFMTAQSATITRFARLAHRRNNPIGRAVGPYVVTGYVGDNPNGEYVTIGCPDCDHAIPPQRRNMPAVKAKKCVGCGREAKSE